MGDDVEQVGSGEGFTRIWVSAGQEVVVVPHADGCGGDANDVADDPEAWEPIKISYGYQFKISPHGENAERPPHKQGQLDALQDSKKLDTSLFLNASAACLFIKSVFHF